MLPLNDILRKFTARYKHSKLQEKINHLMYMVDIKLFAKKEKIGKPNTNCENIQSRYRNRISHRKLRRAINEKWNYQIKLSSEHLEKRKPTNIWEYWKLTPSINRK